MGSNSIKTDWYKENIEEPVRDIVRYLRNNGINTTCSCGHEMLIQVYCTAEDLLNLWNLLADYYNDTNSFEIAFYWHDWHRFAEIRLRMPNGSFNDGWRSRRDWAGYKYKDTKE